MPKTTAEKMVEVNKYIDEVKSRIPDHMVSKPLMHMTVNEILFVISVMMVSIPDEFMN